MNIQPFVHLHLHTCFSMLDGACRLDKLMDAVAANHMPAVAMTDHGVMYGAIDFYNMAKKKGVTPIIGCETYVAEGSRFDRKGVGGKAPSHHLVLLAEDETGYHNLIRLVSAAHLEGFYYKPRIDKELLAAHRQGLIGMSACLKGEISSRLVDDDVTGASRAAGQYADIFGKGSFFLEIQDHGIPEQRKANRLIAELSRKSGLPLVATNDVHYLQKEHAAAHEVLLCLQTQTVMSDPKRMRYQTDEFYLKTREEMDQLFREFPGAVDRTLDIADRCSLEFDFNARHQPSFTPPEGTTPKDYLIQLSREGVRRRYGIEDPLHPKDPREKEILDRFKSELYIIEKAGFIDYFLVVWDFVRFAHEKGIPVGPGRGSGGGSLVAYALGITSIDPLRYSLIFERFLNLERVSPPDFDIDFCQARRGEVIEYVKNKYGRQNVAQIITFGSLGAKTVIRDVGRVLEIPYSDCDRLSKLVPDDPKITLPQALQTNPEFKQAYETDPNCKRILDYGFVLEGLYRNVGTHAAGVVIGEKPLIEIIPLAKDKDDEPITQYSMEPLGKIGLLKMDFLGLKTLTVIHEAVELIEETRGLKLDLDRMSLDDKATYELLSRGDTVGVFQLESAGMRDLIRRNGIDGIEDLIAMIALYRPGPMNMLPDYVDRKSGKAPIRYDHPALEPILKDTYGVMVYQEQVQKAANVLAGYSLGDADILRRAMGKKQQSIMDEQRATFVKGCAKAQRMDAKLAGQIFDTMAKFAGYGFNKAHSAGYAIISYQTAYLKANYPAEFMSALLSSEIGNFDKIPVFIAEAIEMGLKMLAPDINSSGARYKPAEQGIRYGLAGIKNVGEGAAEAIVAERKRQGPFRDLVDFSSRVDGQLVNKKVAESLIRCGAMDSLGAHRARLFNSVDFAMARAANALRDRRSGQGSLFDLLDSNAQPAVTNELPECEAWHENVLLAGERELLGVYMSGHPLTQYAALIERYQLCTVKGLGQLEDNTLTRLGGIVAGVSKKVTKTHKEIMAFLQLETLDGTVEVVVFPEAYREFGMHAAQDMAVLVCGAVSKREDPPKLLAQELYPLAEAPSYFTRRISIHLPATHAESGQIEKIADILRLHPGQVPVAVCLQFPSGEKVFLDTSNGFRVEPSESLIQKLQHELGEQGVYVAVDPEPCRKKRPPRNGWRKNGQSS